MFHLFTHAFFKALLFLGAGAVIHALHHEQDIWKMGGLSKTMRITTATFALGTLALTGCPGLAGFFSKDAILLAAYEHNKLIFGVALVTAFLTAFYMTRLFAVAFLGKHRSEAAHHGHDCPRRMTWPLVILAFLSIFAAYGAVPHWFGVVHHEGMFVPALAILAFLAGTGVAFLLYSGVEKEPLSIPILRNKFYFDDIYGAIVAGTQDVLAFIAAGVDAVLSGVIRFVGILGTGIGYGLRLFQVGNVQAYAFIFGLGAVALVYFLVFR
jgi:NADH-quinone oxidoreductase subunit L